MNYLHSPSRLRVLIMQSQIHPFLVESMNGFVFPSGVLSEFFSLFVSRGELLRFFRSSQYLLRQ